MSAQKKFVWGESPNPPSPPYGQKSLPHGEKSSNNTPAW